MGNSSSSTTSPTTRTDRNAPTTPTSSSLTTTLSTTASNLHTRLTTSPHFPFRGNALNLTKSELDTMCTPSGLYPSCEWDSKTIRRLIGDGRLAPRLRGTDVRVTKSDRECPICFMLYSASNVTKCCEATICTECYLQIKNPKEKNTTCPFCNCPKMSVAMQRGMDEVDIAKREEEEQRVIEGIIRRRVLEVNGEGGTTNSAEAASDGPSDNNAFGSSLEQYNRSRTFSNSSSAVSEGSSEPSSPPKNSTNNNSNNNNTTNNNSTSNASADGLLSLAMSPDARHQLESEMAAQLSHATHQRMQSEAEAERLRHVEEWSRSDSGIRSRMREARIAELTSLLERMAVVNEPGGDEALGLFGLERSGALENLMRIEAAFLNATGDNDGRRRRRNEEGQRRGIVRIPRRGVSTTHMETAEMLMRGISEEEQLAMAIAMSMTEENQRRENGEMEGGEGQSVERESSSHQGEGVAAVAATGENNNGEDVSSSSSDSSDSTSSSDGDANQINNNRASSPSLADGEEEVVFEAELL